MLNDEITRKKRSGGCIKSFKPGECNFLTVLYPFWGQNVGPSWVKNGKKTIFIPATALPTNFSLKKFLAAIVS